MTASRELVADITTYLPGDLLVKVDIASMAHSLECRGPFLDHRVVELAPPCHWKEKSKSEQAAQKSCSNGHSPNLPPPIKNAAPGFGVPISRWFRGDLKNELRDVLLDPVCLGRGFPTSKRSKN